MKRLFEFLFVAVMAWAMSGGVALAEPVFGRKEYKDRQTFEKKVVNKDEVNFGKSAEITSDQRIFYPQNYISNSLMEVWSGGSTWASGGVTAVPDGWGLPKSPYTGVSRMDRPVATTGSGTTIVPGFPHSMFIENWNATTGAGTTAYLVYPGENGVSSSQSWFQQFVGKRVVFGAYVRKDNAQAVASGVTTNFIRPFINTFSGAGYAAGETSFAFGPYANVSGWSVVSAVTTVPIGATALEVGFAMNPTIQAAKATSGDSVYVCAPFLLVDPLRAEYVPVPQEVVWATTPIAFDENSAEHDKDGGTSSYSVAARTRGMISPSATALYLSFQGSNANNNNQIQFRKDTKTLTGTTHYPYGGVGGVSQFAITDWVPLDYNGDFDVYSLEPISGISIFVKGIKTR